MTRGLSAIFLFFLCSFLVLKSNSQEIGKMKKKELVKYISNLNQIIDSLGNVNNLYKEKQLVEKKHFSELSDSVASKTKEIERLQILITDLNLAVEKNGISSKSLNDSIKALNYILIKLTQDAAMNTSAKTNGKIICEEESLSEEEYKVFKNLPEPGILISKRVARYYLIDQDGVKQHIINKLVYDKSTGLIDDTYINYDVFFTSVLYDGSINYSYSAGAMDTAEGSILINNKAIIQTEISFGTGGRTISVILNGRKIYEKSEAF